MATRDVFSEEELAKLWGFPEIGPGEPIRYFTLTPADEALTRHARLRLVTRTGTPLPQAPPALSPGSSRGR